MVSRTDSLEREVKLSADLGLKVPDFRETRLRVDRLPRQELRTTYFDTPDLRLWEQGITLRVRVGEGSGGSTWTLKTDSGDGPSPTLDRMERSWPGDGEIPAEAQRIVQGIVRRAPLGEVAEMVTVRNRLVFLGTDGARCAELDDDVVSVSAGQKHRARFRQLEVEVADDGQRSDAVVRALRRAGAHPDRRPKLAAVLELPHETRLDRRSSLGEVIRSSIVDGLDLLLQHDLRMRLDGPSPAEEDVHQTRVATRRLRSYLKTFQSALDGIWVNHTRSELEWLGGLLGAVRDTDVLARRLETAAEEGGCHPAGEAILRARLDEQRRRCAGELVTVLGSGRYLDLLDRLHAAAHRPPFSDAGRTARQKRYADRPARGAFPGLVRHPWRALRRQVRRAEASGTDRDLHRVRIKAKELRYAAEGAAPVLGKEPRRLAEAAARLQTVLGDHHDAVAAEMWLQHHADGEPAAAFAAGWFSAGQRRRQQELRRTWRSVWRDVDHPKLRDWMG